MAQHFVPNIPVTGYYNPQATRGLQGGAGTADWLGGAIATLAQVGVDYVVDRFGNRQAGGGPRSDLIPVYPPPDEVIYDQNGVPMRPKRRRRRKRLLTCSDKADIAFIQGTLGGGQMGRAAVSALLNRCG